MPLLSPEAAARLNSDFCIAILCLPLCVAGPLMGCSGEGTIPDPGPGSPPRGGVVGFVSGTERQGSVPVDGTSVNGPIITRLSSPDPELLEPEPLRVIVDYRDPQGDVAWMYFGIFGESTHYQVETRIGNQNTEGTIDVNLMPEHHVPGWYTLQVSLEDATRLVSNREDLRFVILWPDGALPDGGSWEDALEDSGDAVGTDGGVDASADSEVSDVSRPETSVDANLEGASEDANVVADQEVVDAADAEDSSGPQTVLTFRTLSVAPNTFKLSISKTGDPLTWDLGDGSEPVVGNDINYQYASAGEKVVRATSTDGVEGVTRIFATSTNLTGEMPPEIGTLASLTELTLCYNQLSGTIPPELGNLGSLTSVALYENQLTGTIPPELGNLGSLTQLSCYRNQLSGTIPPELGNLGSLTTISLFENQLTGTIPPELGHLSSLTQLRLHRNQLSGTIPPELGNLGSLTRISLFENQLSGSIPPELGNLGLIEDLPLQFNQLSGCAPGSLGGLISVKDINLNDNALSQIGVDSCIDDIHARRTSYIFPGKKYLDISGTNSAPSATALAQIAVLQGNYNWIITCTGGCD